MKDTLPLLELPEKEHGAGKFLAMGFHLCNEQLNQYIRMCKKESATKNHLKSPS
jgi:hypothetical protein